MEQCKRKTKIYVVLISVLVGLHFDFISALELPGIVLEETEKKLTTEKTTTLSTEKTMSLTSDDSMEIKNEVNLETITTKLNDQDLYEHVRKKDNNVNERSFIFIENPKFKVPHLNLLPSKKNYQDKPKYQTFLSHIGPIDFLKFDNLPPRYHKPPLIVPMAEVKDMFIPLSGPFSKQYPGIPSSKFIENEMNVLSNKVNIANGAIGLQYQDSRLKDDLINMHTKFQGLMYSDYNGKYPKDNNLNLNLKEAQTNREKLMQKNKITDTEINKQQHATYKQPSVQPQTPTLTTQYSEKQNEMKPNGYRLQNEKLQNPFSADPQNDGVLETKPNIPKHDEHREYIELLKPPLLRSKLGASIDINNNIFDRYKQSLAQNDNFHQETFSEHNINKPYRMKNDVRVKQNTQYNSAYNGDIRRGLSHNKYPESVEEPEFHDMRLAKKIEEINDMSAALTADNQRDHERKDPIQERYYVNNNNNNSRPEVESNNGKGYPETKPNCVYPICGYKNEDQRLPPKSDNRAPTQAPVFNCKCPVDKDRSAPMSPKSYSFSAEVIPVDINSIRQYEH